MPSHSSGQGSGVSSLLELVLGIQNTLSAAPEAIQFRKS